MILKAVQKTCTAFCMKGIQMSKRSYFWDNYKGVLIFLVVLGHFLYAYALKYNGDFVDDLFTFIYVFHMPAFVFCSGYLSKSENARSKTSQMKLLLYYLIFNTAMMLYAYYFMDTSLKLLTPYYSYWYILSLIFWRAFIGDLSKIKGIVPLSVIVCLLLGYWGEFSNLLSIRRTVAFFIFFLLGYKFERETFEKFMEKRNTKWIVAGILLTILLIAGIFWIIQNYNITLNMLLLSAYKNTKHVFYRVFLLGAAFMMILAMMLITPKQKIPFLTKIGKNSLLIYLVHRFITLVYVSFFPTAQYENVQLLYMLIGTVLTCMLLGGDTINKLLADKVNYAADCIVKNDEESNRTKLLILLAFIACLSLKPLLS